MVAPPGPAPGRRAVFLDRDGVLNETVERRPPRTTAELVIVDGALEAITALRRAGFATVVVTNQPDVARGTVSAEVIRAINQALTDALPLDAVFTCPHDGPDACRCRKPAPGMLLDAADALDLDLAGSWLVGDRWVDIAAGRAAGVATVLVERSTSWLPTSSGSPPATLVPDARVASVGEAATLILAALDAQRAR